MSRLAQFSSWSLLLAALIALYRPGLNGPLVFDDIPNIADNPAMRVTDLTVESLYRAALSGHSSDFKRPLSMLSFAVNYALDGGQVHGLKATNLAVHAVNVLLVGIFTLILVRGFPCFGPVRERAPPIALLVAAVWGLHPLQVSTTLYVVQRMTLLSTLFTLVALILYVIGRLRQQQGRPGMPLVLLAALVFMPLAFLSKETGILFLAYALVIELFATQPAWPGAKAQLSTPFLLVTTFVGIVMASLYLWLKTPDFAPNYYAKGFTPTERLLTEPRVLLWYLRMIVLPDIRAMGLTHDDWLISHSLLQPPSTVFAMVALVATAVALPWLRSTRPAAAFCIAWFLAGHSIESGPLPLDLMYEHRNYLPSLGVFIALTSLSVHALDRSVSLARMAPAIAAAVLVTLSILTGLRIYEWRSPLHWGIAQTTHHPGSAASFLDLGSIYASMASRTDLGTEADRQRFFEQADAAFVEAARLNPRMANGPASRIIMRLVAGKDVPEDLYDELVARVRVGGMMVSTQSALIKLLECVVRERCPMAREPFLRLVNAALENPDCPPLLSSQALALTAEYYGTREKDIRMAITMAKAATEVPSAPVQAWIALIRWLSVGGHLQQAREALDELDRHDRMDELAQERREIRAALDKVAPIPEGSASPR